MGRGDGEGEEGCWEGKEGMRRDIGQSGGRRHWILFGR